MKKYETADREMCFLFSQKEFVRWKYAAAAACALFVVGMGVFSYSAYSVAALRQENDLYQKQLKMADEKIEGLTAKVDGIEKLSEELSSMTGMNAAESPQTAVTKNATGGIGGAHTVPDAANPKKEYRASKTPTVLLSRMTELDKRVDENLKNLVKLRVALQFDGVMEKSAARGFSATIPSVWPVVGTVTSAIGWRQSSGIESTYHEGIDIATDYNTPIHATADGVVSRSGWMDGYGYLVEIRHADGFTTRYGHNSALLVGEGQDIRQGDTIALAGSTGNSTGSHCHYEVRINGRAVDPMMFLPTK